MAIRMMVLLIGLVAGAGASWEEARQGAPGAGKTIANTSACPRTRYPCGDGDIRYPFWIDDKVSGCGYPNLRLECRGGTPVLPLPSGDYIIKSIRYDDRTVSVIDLVVSKNTSCPIVAGRSLMLPTGSPPPLSLTEQDTNLTFIMNCNFSETRAHIVPCLESTDRMRHTYVFRDDDDDVMPYSQSRFCEDVVEMPVLRSSMSISTGSLDVVMPALANGFELRWRPAAGGDCGDCERAGGFCGVEHQDEAEQAVFKCFSDSASKYLAGTGRKFTPRLIIGSSAIGVIIFVALIALLLLHCGMCGAQTTDGSREFQRLVTP